MKRSRLPNNTAKNASSLHKKVGELLTSPILAGYTPRQELRVSTVNPEFGSNREKFDWALLDINVVIECMGRQHEVPTDFGKGGKEEAKRNLKEIQARDETKRQAALDAGWGYVVVYWYEIEEMTPEILLKRILRSMSVPPERKKFGLKQQGETQ